MDIFSLRRSLEQARDGMLDATTDGEIREWCRSIMQEFVTRGQALATSDDFAARYPAQAKAWAEVQWLALHPSAHLGYLLPLLKSFGRWLVREVERTQGILTKRWCEGRLASRASFAYGRPPTGSAW